MPFINTKTNIELTDKSRTVLKKEFGGAVSKLGKTESWLMLGFEDKCDMSFRGESEVPMAFIDVSLYGKASTSAYNRMTEKLTLIITKELNIPSDHIYVAYREVEHWGWNGGNF